MKSNYTNDGEFYVDKVSKRRVLCFAFRTPDGRHVVGASRFFRQAEAYDKALRAACGTLPVPTTESKEDTLTMLLKLRGFPVENSAFELSDRTASYLESEFAQR